MRFLCGGGGVETLGKAALTVQVKLDQAEVGEIHVKVRTVQAEM
jgi:hypothetical protein